MVSVNKFIIIKWTDNLRALATISVVLVHVSMGDRELAFQPELVYSSFARFCVPVFLMLTGALLLDKEYSLSIFLRKRFFRTLLPFIFWSLFYISKDLLKEDKLSVFHVIYSIGFKLANGVAMHLWYVYMIIGIYLFIPIIGKAVRFCSANELAYFLLIWFFIQFSNYPVISNFTLKIDFTFFSGYLGYVILGYYLTNFNVILSAKKISFLIIIGFVTTALGTFFYSKIIKSSNYLFFEYLTPNVILFSTGVFLLAKKFDNFVTNRYSILIRDFISKYSYGIYLVHILVLLLVNKMGLSWYTITPLIGIPLTTIVVVTISAIIICIVNKLPLGKYVSG